jgi:hypothetical protein
VRQVSQAWRLSRVHLLRRATTKQCPAVTLAAKPHTRFGQVPFASWGVKGSMGRVYDMVD